MRAVVTRVSSASVSVGGKTISEIGNGFLVLLGIAPEDTQVQVKRLSAKICSLRVFEDENGKMNLSLDAVGGSILVVSQFTLYASFKSRRPGFTGAAGPEIAKPLYEQFIYECKNLGYNVHEGIFGADMLVESVNDGPVTLILDTDTL